MHMVAACLQLLLVALANTGQPTAAKAYRAFSCDTAGQNASIAATSAISSAVKLGIVHSAACPVADATVDPLGPCFVSPAEVKAALAAVPPGLRAISLEGGSLYYLEHMTDRTPHKPVWYFLDNLPAGSTWKNHTTSGPWFDTWSATLHRRFTAWFAKFKAIGGEVDYVLSDFELGGHVSYYHFNGQPTFGAPAPALQAMADPRWPKLQAALNAAGARHGVSFSRTEMAKMDTWGQHDLHGYVWNAVLLDNMIPAALNASVFEPIRAYFPNVQLSNFAHGHRCDASQPLPAQSVGWWPYNFANMDEPPVGRGGHVGTASARGFYGGNPSTNSSVILATATPDRMQSTNGNSFDALLLSAATARDMASAAPRVPVHPWFAPRLGLWHECGPDGKTACGWSWLAGRGGENDTMWQENIMHVALALATDTFLWWQPGGQRPKGIGLDELAAVMAELEGVLDTVAVELLKAPAGSCKPLHPLTKLDNRTWIKEGWSSSALLSGMRVKCGADGKIAAVYRFTPRCIDVGRGFTAYCSKIALGVRNGSQQVGWRLGSGFGTVPVAEAQLLLPRAPTSSRGWWLIVPPHRSDLAESSVPVLKSDDEKTAIARSRWGTNVHWVECSLHELCPRNPIGPGGGPKPGELAQLSTAFGVVRTGIRWFLVEQQRGVFNFTIYDKLLDELDDAGVKLYGILADGNPIYNCSYAPQSVAQQEAFARFAVAIMAHYRGRGVTWELWNEPNNDVKASTFSSLLHTVGAAVRGSVAKKEMLVGPTTSGISLSYIESIAATGALQYLDAISVHPYRATPPESVLFDYTGLRAVLKKYSYSHLPLFSSEWGYGSCKDPNGTAAPCTTPTGAPRANDVVTEHEQASRLARMFLINDAANVSLSIWYEWINDVADGVAPLSSESNFGAVHRDYLNGSGPDAQPRREKPTFHAAHTLQQLLGGRFPTGAKCDTGEGTYAVRYSGVDGKHGGGDSWAVWLTNSSARRSKCDHRPNMCCRYTNNTIIPGCASAEGCKKRGCCWDPNPEMPGYWCSHYNPTGRHRNASVLPFTLPGCREVFDMFGTKTSRICPVGTDLNARQASKGEEENGRSGAVFSTWGAEFALTTDPQYLVPISGQVDERRDQPPQDGFCLRPNTRAKTDDTILVQVECCAGRSLNVNLPAHTSLPEHQVAIVKPVSFKTDDQAQTSLSHYQLDSNAPMPPPPTSPHLFNVLDFGALGDGLHDDTDALQRALDAAGAATRGRSDHDDSTCAHPTLLFPSGRYKLSRTLLAKGSTCGHNGKDTKGNDEGCVNPANLRGESALLIQTNVSADILYNPSVWHWSITGLHFASGRNHIYLGNNDTNKGFVTIRDCLFANASSAAVRTMGPNWWTGEGSYYSRGTASTQVCIKDSQFYDNERVAVNWCDSMVISDAWVEGVGPNGTYRKALFENHDKLFLVRMLGVPAPVIPGHDQRWVDNAHGGRVFLQSSRFGGEEGGFTVVVNKASFLCAPANRSHWMEHGSHGYKNCMPPPGAGPLPPNTEASTRAEITIDSCELDSYGNKERNATIYLEAIPSRIVIRNSRGFNYEAKFLGPNIPHVIRVDPHIDLNGPQLDVAAKHPGLLRYEIDRDNTFIPDGGDGFTDPGLPQQLWPYQANRVEALGPPTAGIWRRHQVVYARPNASTTAIGWQCVTSGKPGVWKEITVRGVDSESEERMGVDDQTALASSSAAEIAERLVQSVERLAELRRSGMLSEVEFVRAKATVLQL